MKELLGDACAVKFHFVNECPGYVGDLFLIQSACLSTEIPVVRLIRDRFGKIVLLDEPESFIFEVKS